ncbi:MAG: phosphatidate cytidylyltransferase, partial [Flavisolibacter sp.]|nr:phosphatidate cytidylyltransferase [Flavisolibacter sp.]
LSSCEVIGGIFKAGFWTAIILVVIVVVLILWLVNRSRK